MVKKVVILFVIYLFLVVVIGGILLQFAIPMAENAATVLGASIGGR